jgi:septal ring factor EnvC (AmiA/AmiB activator)
VSCKQPQSPQPYRKKTIPTTNENPPNPTSQYVSSHCSPLRNTPASPTARKPANEDTQSWTAEIARLNLELRLQRQRHDKLQKELYFVASQVAHLESVAREKSEENDQLYEENAVYCRECSTWRHCTHSLMSNVP